MQVTTVGQWPLDVPVGTAIPAWAYQDVKSRNTFNLTLAQADDGELRLAVSHTSSENLLVFST